jgi:hypothetical protein
VTIYSVLRLETVPDLWTTDEPDSYMVYAALREGGYVTLFYGTEGECTEFVRNFPTDRVVKQKPRVTSSGER